MSSHCKICNSETELKFTGEILRKYTIQYFQCKSCYFMFTETPYWLEEAYKSVINAEDTGVLQRNLFFAKRIKLLLPVLFSKQDKYLDYGGGYGVFTRLMRDAGLDYYWKDAYSQNLLARGFEAGPGDRFTALTAFEVFEHLVEPVEEVAKMLAVADNLFFSTEILATSPIPSKDWWYWGFSHGQHTSFYSLESLEALAGKFNLRLHTNKKNFHLLAAKHINKSYYNLLLKSAQLPFIHSFLGLQSKTAADSALLAKRRHEELL